MDLNVQSRKVTGKNVKLLRRQGIAPLHLYGHGLESLALQANAGELQKAMGRVGTTSLLGILIDGATTPRNVVIREIQRHPMTGKLLHVDLYQVSMAEKIKMEVSIRLIGEAPALKSSDNQLVQELETLDIECLPAQIPANITLDVSSLTEAGKELFVKDIKPIAGVVILNNPEQLVAKPEEKKEVKPEAAAPVTEAEMKKE
jgi:large subunit ribosomal protein L25